MRAYLSPVARLFISLIFILSAFNKITHFDSTATMMSGLGIPMPQLCEVVAILLELLGGFGLLLGFRTRWSAAALILFTVLATLLVHMRLLQDPSLTQDLVHNLKNLAILGGLIKFYLDGPGSYAVDRTV